MGMNLLLLLHFKNGSTHLTHQENIEVLKICATKNFLICVKVINILPFGSYFKLRKNREAVKIKRRSSSCSEDEDKLRKVSEKVTMKSRKFAQAMGTVDSMEVTGIRPKSNSIVKRLSNSIRGKKKTVTPKVA